MAWIQSHQTLGRHPKTQRAARLLGITKAAMIGHLHFLWWWALDYAKDGDLGSYAAADIAEAAEWKGDPAKFIEALVVCGVEDFGFLEKGVEGGLVVHDWYDYAGKLIEKREGNADRMKKVRMAKRRSSPPAPPAVLESGMGGNGTVKPAVFESGLDATGAEHPGNYVTTNVSDETARDAHVQSTCDERAAHVQGLEKKEKKEKKEREPPSAGDLSGSAPTPEDLMRVWNENRGSMHEARGLNADRRRVAKARLREEPGLDFWAKLVRDLAASAFYCGENDRGWVADFDYFTRPKTLTKAREGGFSPRNGVRPTGAVAALNPADNEARRRKALGLPLLETKGAA